MARRKRGRGKGKGRSTTLNSPYTPSFGHGRMKGRGKKRR